MKPRRIIGLDVDWIKMADMQEILVVNEARIARLRRQLEEIADLLEKDEQPALSGPRDSSTLT